jgi:1-deoxy-D-xylulose-5-phosphate synthase
MWDLSLLGLVPGMRVAAPRDGGTARELLAEAVADDDGPTAVRFPKGRVGPDLPAVDRLGTADVLVQGYPDGVLLIAVGALAATAVAAAEELAASGVPTTVADPRWLLPVDPALLAAATGARLVVTLEDNGVAGGYGDAFCRALREARMPAEVCTLGLPQRFLPHGERPDLLADVGLDVPGVVRAVRGALGRLDGRGSAPRKVRALG